MNVPKLRFRGFDIEWNTIDLKNIFNYFSTNSLSRDQLSSNGKVKNIHYGDIHKKFPTIVDVEKNVNTYIKDINYINKYELCKNGDLIFADASEDYDGIGKVIEIINIDCDTISGLHTIMARDIKDIFAPKYKGYYFNSPVIHNQLRIMANGFKVYGISKDNIGKLNAKIPSKEEQFKIAKTLELLDRKIELQTKKIEDLKLFKKGLFNNNIDDTKNIKLSDILTEVSIKSTINNQYEILSSTANGLYLQKDYFNKQAASENNTGYKILKRNQLVLSPQNLWMGNININDKYDIGIVSPSYKIFDIDDNIINIDFFNNWIKSPRALYDYMISSEQGASVVRRNLNIDLFNEIIIKVPERNIQDKIGKQIKNINMKIELENRKLDKLNDLKKGLMQNMFV